MREVKDSADISAMARRIIGLWQSKCWVPVNTMTTLAMAEALAEEFGVDGVIPNAGPEYDSFQAGELRFDFTGNDAGEYRVEVVTRDFCFAATVMRAIVEELSEARKAYFAAKFDAFAGELETKDA